MSAPNSVARRFAEIHLTIARLRPSDTEPEEVSAGLAFTDAAGEALGDAVVVIGNFEEVEGVSTDFGDGIGDGVVTAALARPD